MHIYIDNGTSSMPELDLPFDFWPELSRTNPFLTEEGSQSIPLTLPASEHNMKLINFSYRGTSTKRPLRKTSAILSEGTNWLKGTLYIEQINKVNGIECTFYTNEGQLYEKIKEYKLEDLDWPIFEGVGNDYATKAKYWMNKFSNVQMGIEPQPDEYFVFCLETSSPFNVEKNSGTNTYLVLNETKYENSLISFRAMDKQTYTTEAGENQTEYTAPVGYGVTPFLRVGFILRHIFSYFGYNLETNIFDTDISLKRLVLLNNVADSIVNGNINFKQLLPNDLQVEDLINSIRNKFGIEFIEFGNKIKIKQWQSVLKSKADMDLSMYVNNHPTLIWEEKSALSLKLEILSRDNLTFESIFYKESFTHPSPSGYKSVEIKSSDKTPINDIVYSPYLHRDHEYTVYLRAPFIGGIQHKNTELLLNTGEVEEDKNDESPLAFCFSVPLIQTWSSNMYPVIYKYFTGSIFSFDGEGKKWGTISLVVNKMDTGLNENTSLKDNLYTLFYENRDNMLKNANQQLTFESFLPTHLISTMDISTPKIIQGMKVLIERIDYVLGHPDLCQITARTLHQYPE